jgi:hypothetical protein
VIPEKAAQATHREQRRSAGGRPVSHDATPYEARLHLWGAMLWLRSIAPHS